MCLCPLPDTRFLFVLRSPVMNAAAIGNFHIAPLRSVCVTLQNIWPLFTLRALLVKGIASTNFQIGLLGFLCVLLRNVCCVLQ